MNFNFEKLRSQDASVIHNVNNNFKLNVRFGKDPAKSDSTKSYKTSGESQYFASFRSVERSLICN